MYLERFNDLYIVYNYQYHSSEELLNSCGAAQCHAGGTVMHTVLLSSRTRSTLSYLHYLGARASTRSVSLRGFALGVFFNRILASTWCGEKQQNRRRKHVRALLVFIFGF
jgi:hypothetical protein